jgi:uncharacterized phiE125 gp8 family phage protein
VSWTRGWRTSPPHTSTLLITPPTIEPLTLAEAKRHLRIVTDDENGEILRWIRTARRQVEQDTGRALLTQTWDLFQDGSLGSGWITLPIAPVQTVTSVNSTSSAGTETVWSATHYVVDTASVPARLGLTDSGSWPSDLRAFQPIRVRFVAGWTTAALLPPDLLAAVTLLLGWLSENRQPAPFEQAYYDRLIAPYQVFTAA